MTGANWTPPAADLTVVVVAPSGMTTLGPTLGCLAAQTMAERIEVVIVAPTAGEIDPDALGARRFARLLTLGVGPISERGRAAAAGIDAATAAVVSLLEDHSYPEPEWAAALLAAHAEPWAGVGPRVENANPGTAVSRVTFWLTYAAMSGPQEAGPRTLLPWHNTAYKREILAGYGARIGELLAWEGDLQVDLLARGHQLYLESAARTHHANVSALRSALGLHFHRGRIFGAQRAVRERWGLPRRLAYVAALPLFPLMQMRHVTPQLERLGVSTRAVIADAPALAAMLAAMALGEGAGYLTGVGTAKRRLEDYELRRRRHLS